jgi:hypothetical protein
MYGPQQQPYYQQPRYAAPAQPVTPAAPKPAAAALVEEVEKVEEAAVDSASANTYNAQIPGSFMAMFWLLAIGVFALVIAVITKLYCQHKRGAEA